jgi:hypothetical protein
MQQSAQMSMSSFHPLARKSITIKNLNREKEKIVMFDSKHLIAKRKQKTKEIVDFEQHFFLAGLKVV